MEEVERIHGPQLEDVPPELIDRIQSFLPVEELARTCVLSKSWLHTWYTTPTLRFRPPKSKQQLYRYTDFINHTLKRYLRVNIPITSFDLHFRFINQESLPFVNKWVHTVASRSSLKEFYLRIYVLEESISLPDELFLGKNLDTISVKADPHFSLLDSFYISNNLVIKCVNLRVLEFIDVTLRDETLVNLLSTCILLEKINLSKCDGLSRIKVRNLHHLRELNITPVGNSTSEIYDVPSLHIFKHNLLRKRNNLVSNSLESVRELVLKGEIMDDAYSNIISKFPFLESLSLHIFRCKLNTVDITSVSLKRLTVYLSRYDMQIDIKVYAPKLNNIHYKGKSVPGLLFPSIAPSEIELTLELFDHINRSFFLKTREVLNLSTNFNIKITTADNTVSFNNDILNMRSRIQIPAMNVKLLTLNTYLDKGLWERPRLLLETFFSVMRPNYLTVEHPGIRGPLKLIAKELMELKTRKYWSCLKKVKIQNRVDEKWITLKSSWITSSEGLAFLDYYCGNFELTWCSL